MIVSKRERRERERETERENVTKINEDKFAFPVITLHMLRRFS